MGEEQPSSIARPPQHPFHAAMSAHASPHVPQPQAAGAHNRRGRWRGRRVSVFGCGVADARRERRPKRPAAAAAGRTCLVRRRHQSPLGPRLRRRRRRELGRCSEGRASVAAGCRQAAPPTQRPALAHAHLVNRLEWWAEGVGAARQGDGRVAARLPPKGGRFKLGARLAAQAHLLYPLRDVGQRLTSKGSRCA